MCGTSSTWVVGGGATTTVLCQQPRTVLLGVSHPQGYKSPSRGGMGGRDKGRSAPQKLPAAPQKKVGSSPPPNLLCNPWSKRSPPTRTCQEVRHRVSPCANPVATRPAMSPAADQNRDTKPKGRGRPRVGSHVVTHCGGTGGQLRFGDILGGSWSHLLACSLYKYLSRGKDIKSTVQ